MLNFVQIYLKKQYFNVLFILKEFISIKFHVLCKVSVKGTRSVIYYQKLDLSTFDVYFLSLELTVNIK